MHLVQILLPLYDNKGRPIRRAQLKKTAGELTRRFGGLTAHTRSPVEGLWQQGKRAVHDDLVIYEIVVKRLQRRWWREYRRELESDYKQVEIVMRTFAISKL